MTCIVGLEDEGKVYIGGDSAGVDSGWNYMLREDKKVFRNGKMIFGFTSSFRMGQLLQYKLKIPRPKKTDTDDFGYLCTTFMDALIKCFKDSGYAHVNNSKVSGGTFLLGYKGKLYQVQSDYQVSRVLKPFDACGCGEPYALGAMEVLYLDKKISPEEKILKALEVAETFSAGVRGPFNVVSI